MDNSKKFFVDYKPDEFKFRFGSISSIQASVGAKLRSGATREEFTTRDGDEIFLDTLHPDNDPEARPDAPIAIMLHGLASSARIPYVQRLIKASSMAGFRAVGINLRCSTHKLNKRPQLYHAGFTDDLEDVVNHLAQRYPAAKIVMSAYSLGGSILLNYLGKCDVPAAVVGALAVCAPLALDGSIMDSTIFHRAIFRPACMKVLRENMGYMATYPEVREQAQKAMKVAAIRDFDDAWTAPVNGFDGYQDYYHKMSAVHVMPKIRVPTLILHARDDVIVPKRLVAPGLQTMRDNSALVHVVTKHGGHCGFCGAQDGDGLTWLERETVRLFSHYVKV